MAGVGLRKATDSQTAYKIISKTNAIVCGMLSVTTATLVSMVGIGLDNK